MWPSTVVKAIQAMCISYLAARAVALRRLLRPDENGVEWPAAVRLNQK
jgi:hypothetical protein